MLAGLTGLLGGGGGGTAFESIATATGTGLSSTITFSSIPATYKHLQVRVLARATAVGATSVNLALRLNGDTGSNYASHRLLGDGATVSANGSTSQSNINTGLMSGALSTANIMGVTIYDIVDYSSTTKNTVVRSLSGLDQNGTGEIYIGSGLWVNTAAVNSVTLFCGTGFLTTETTIALYGIKG
jgi:hypothetical protein